MTRIDKEPTTYLNNDHQLDGEVYSACSLNTLIKNSLLERFLMSATCVSERITKEGVGLIEQVSIEQVSN